MTPQKLHSVKRKTVKFCWGHIVHTVEILQIIANNSLQITDLNMSADTKLHTKLLYSDIFYGPQCTYDRTLLLQTSIKASLL